MKKPDWSPKKMELPETSLDKLTAAFKALGVQAPSLLTKIGMLRSLINEIDAAKKDGYSYGLILETLIANGFKKTTLNQFYGLMNRIRLECGFAHLADKSEEKRAPAAPDLLGRSRRSGDKEESVNKTTETLIPQQMTNQTSPEENEKKDGISKVQEVLMQRPKTYPPRKK